jgi:hypothetical protein
VTIAQGIMLTSASVISFFVDAQRSRQAGGKDSTLATAGTVSDIWGANFK